MTPSIAEPRLTKLADPVALESNEVGNVRLLQDREARAGHDGGNEPLEQAGCQADWMKSAIDFCLQNIDELVRCLEDPVPLAQSDVLGFVPGELLQSADEALKRTLRTAPREGTLWDLFSDRYLQAGINCIGTYASGVLDMLRHHGQLLFREETSKRLVWRGQPLGNGWNISNPLHGVCLRKQNLHQFGLV